MPEIQVNFYASLRKISASKTEGFQIPESGTVSNLLELVIERYPLMKSKLLAENGELDRRAHIIVNGRNCLLLAKGLASSLSLDDSVDIFPIGHF